MRCVESTLSNAYDIMMKGVAIPALGAWRDVEGYAGREDCEQTSLFLVKEVGRVNR